MKPLSLLMNKAARLGGSDPLAQLALPGPHEARIAELFEGRCRFEGDAPVFPRRLVILAFTNRSGSNLLADYMRQTGRVGGLGEFLNHDLVAKWAPERGITSMPDYMQDLHDLHRGGPQNALGVKASWDQMAMLLRWNIPAMFPRVTVVHIMRRDTLAQAVSYQIALQTRAWTSKHVVEEATAEPEVDMDAVAANIAQFHRANLMIRLIVEAYGLERFDVGYEQIVNAPKLNLPRVLRAAGLVGDKWVPRPPSLKRQANDRNAEIAEAFRARLRAAVTG